MYGSFPEDSHDSQGILSHWVGWEVMVTHFDQLVLINFLGMLFFYSQVRLHVALGDSLDDAQHIELDQRRIQQPSGSHH